jgi:Isopropylmalate/homocitrate/citramalate synthases
MSVNCEGEKKIILDKSLTEILKVHRHINSAYIIEFLSLMKVIGVDYFQVNSSTLDKMMIYPEFSGYYVYNIESMEDFRYLYVYNFKYLSIDFEKFLTMPLMDCKNKIDKSKIIMNIALKDLKASNIETIKYILSCYDIEYLMIKNLSKCNNSSWEDFIIKLKETFNLKIGFCAENSLYMGTALSIELCLDGADMIAGAFNGEEYGFTPIEEVLTALKVITTCNISGDLSFLSKLTEVYKKLTYKSIPGDKAVIGGDIFKYESGIHADGIEKNPLTYEPYNPREVGQKRELLIGKHSGTKAVCKKLKQLNIDYGTVDINLLLTKVRNKSIYLKRNIRDEELFSLCEELKPVVIR